MVRLAPIALLTLISSGALAAVLDFNQAPQRPYYSEIYLEDGYRIQIEQGHFDIWGPPSCGSDCTSNYLAFDDYGGFGPVRLRLTQANGENFDLFSLTVLWSSKTNVVDPPPTPECGYNCIITSSNDGLLPIPSFTTMSFSGPEWTNIAWVEFYTFAPGNQGDGFSGSGIDDINLAPSTVPIPGAAWLLASALGLLASRRKA